MRADAGVVPCKFLAWQRETAPQAASRPAPLKGELRRKPVRGGSTPQTLKIPNYKQKQQNRRAASALLAARRLLV